MSSETPLQLFPPPPSKKNRPKRKGSLRRYPVKPATPDSVVTTSKTPITTAQEIIIRVSSDSTKSPSLKSLAEAHVIDHPARSWTPTTIAASERTRAASPAYTNNTALSGSPTLVRANSGASSHAPQMRSMFPRYNPNVPLSQQRYVPTQASPTYIQKEHISKLEYSQERQATGPATAPASTTTFPAGALSKPQPQYSSLSDLTGLWEAANGQGTKETDRTFTLQMSRDGVTDSSTSTVLPAGQEAFTFGASRDEPFYDLQTLKHNDADTLFSECIVRRRNPTKGVIVPVVTLSLESPSRRLPPQDGLITRIYPKLAALMALDKATSSPTSTTAKGNTTPLDVEKIAEEALAHAADRESCALRWDNEYQQYRLWHPSLDNGKGRTFVVQIDNNGESAGFDVPGAKGIIRLGTLDGRDTLVSLEFSTSTLVIDTLAAGRVSSLYIVDVAVTAVLAVALVEGRRIRERRVSAPPQMQSSLTAPKELAVPCGVVQQSEVEGQEELPKAAQGILSVLFLVFRFLVWTLSMLVNAIAAVVVTLSACFVKKS
ncbi:MAG: hypothetical protein M1812_000397 [Candelaria pacifica]|nr:MAG: hypothetical protein M1812_000397 [Candelaria pacifica]